MQPQTRPEGFMDSRKDQKTLRNYPEQGSSSLTFEAFRRRFNEFLEVNDLDPKAKADSLEAFFEIVQEHIREKENWNAGKEAISLNDHRDCEKLIKGIRNRLKQFLNYLDKATKQAKGPISESLGRDAVTKITAEPTWEDLLSDYATIIRSQRAKLAMINNGLKNANRELTIDLLNFIAEEFPDSTDPKKQNQQKKKQLDQVDQEGELETEHKVMIGAVFAGAGLYDEETLADDAGPIERIPMKVSRARQRIRDIYSNPESPRNNPAVIARRKKQRLLRQSDGITSVVEPMGEKTK
jgi:hypothetical protein